MAKRSNTKTIAGKKGSAPAQKPVDTTEESTTTPSPPGLDETDDSEMSTEERTNDNKKSEAESDTIMELRRQLKEALAAKSETKGNTNTGEHNSSLIAGAATETSTGAKGRNDSGEEQSDRKKKKLVVKELELDNKGHDDLKTSVRTKIFATIKFARDLDLRRFAKQIGLKELKIKEHKVEHYIKCIEKMLVYYTTLHRCAILRSYKARLTGTLRLSTQRKLIVGGQFLNDRLFHLSLTALLRAIKGASYDLKETLIVHATNIPHVVLAVEYETAGQGYKDVWRWIVMRVLPLVSSAWKARVEAGDRGKTVTNNMWECVTTSDVAFVFALLQWGAKNYVRGDELELHKAKMEEIKWKKALAANVEPGVKKEDLTGYAELDSDVTDKTDELANSKSSEDESNDDTDEDDGEETGKEDSDGNVEESEKKRGRKKGEMGFGAPENVELFNGYGRVLEDVLDCPRKAKIADTWNIQAMKWVNKDVIEVDDDDDDDDGMDGKTKRNKRQKTAPFVPKDRFGFGNTGY